MTMSGDNAALQFLESQPADEPESSHNDSGSEDQGSSVDAKAKPQATAAKPKPDAKPPVDPDELDRRTIELSERQRKIDQQVQVERRRKEATDRQEAAVLAKQKVLDAREKELDEAERDITADWERRAKKRGVPIETIHTEMVEIIKNGGKPSRELLNSRELEALKQNEAKRERLAKEQAELDQQRTSQATCEQWGEELGGKLGFASDATPETLAFSDAAKTTWPKLTAQAPMLVRREIISLTNEYLQETGQLPDQAKLLEYLESQLPALPEAQAAKPPAAKQPRPVVPSPGDENSTAGKRTKPMTQQERDKAALDFLDSLPD